MKTYTRIDIRTDRRTDTYTNIQTGGMPKRAENIKTFHPNASRSAEIFIIIINASVHVAAKG